VTTGRVVGLGRWVTVSVGSRASVPGSLGSWDVLVEGVTDGVADVVDEFWPLVVGGVQPPLCDVGCVPVVEGVPVWLTGGADCCVAACCVWLVGGCQPPCEGEVRPPPPVRPASVPVPVPVTGLGGGGGGGCWVVVCGVGSGVVGWAVVASATFSLKKGRYALQDEQNCSVSAFRFPHFVQMSTMDLAGAMVSAMGSGRRGRYRPTY
jgi:hypothetical protein